MGVDVTTQLPSEDMETDVDSCAMNTTPSTVALSYDNVPVNMNSTSSSGGVDEAIQNMTARLNYLSIYSESYNEQSFEKKARKNEKRGNVRQNTCPRGQKNIAQIRLLSAAEDCPRMQITISNLTYNALMDTGATQCFIGERMLAATGCLRTRSSEKHRTHIPYVPHELGFRELSLKVLHVFGNHEILSSLDWDEKLVAAQRLLLQDVLTSVSGVFSENPGCSLIHEHGITLKKDAKMPRHPFRTFNTVKKAIMIKLVEELEALGLIERATGRLNCIADALSCAPLSTEEILADDYLETKEPTHYWPDWNGNEPGEEEGDTNNGQKVRLYGALTDYLSEIPPTGVDIIAEQQKDLFCILITEYFMMDEDKRKQKNKKFSKEFKEKAKGFLLDSHITDVNIDTNIPDNYCMIVKFHPTFEEELNDSGAGFKAYILPTLVRRIIFTCHGHPLSGHAGISKILHRAQQLYFWPKISKDIKRYVRGCLHCQQYKPPHKRPHAGPYVPHNMAYPWETICVDLCGPKPTAQGLKKWILVIVDQCTKYVELFPLATASSTTIVKKMNEVACRWGHPSKIISDNGSQF
uniref:RNA-directed DNA polymerase n=1 Tax=Strigamia maritima TaxID=126957 RepID=T1J143_STRMM